MSAQRTDGMPFHPHTTKFVVKLFTIVICFVLMTIVSSQEAASSSPQPTYTVIAPSKLRPNLDYHVSVSVHDVINPIEVDITISGPSETGQFNTVSKTVVVNPSETRIMNFEIGEWAKGNYKLFVAGRGSFTFNNETALEFEQKSYSVFIQTDKAIYKPGQIVQFRAVVVNPSLRPTVTGAIDMHVKDAKGNRIKQWNRVFTSRGIVAQELQLSDQPVLGDWTIVVEVLGQKFQKGFTVAEYVLPTFDVEVLLPKYATYNKSDVVATIKSTYTYGKPVKGEVTLTVQPRVRYNMLAVRPLEQYQAKVPIDGSVDIPVNVVRDLNLKTDFFEREIEFFALVEEGLTGRKYNRSNVLKIHDKEIKVELVKTSKTFKPGLKYTAFLKVAYQDDVPVEDNGPPLKLRYGYSYNDDSWTNIMMLQPTKGLIKLEFYPPRDKDVFVLGMRAEYRGQTYYLETVDSAQSPSNNFLQVLMLNSKTPKVGQEVRFEINATEPLNRIVYEVMGRGDIVFARSEDIHNTFTHSFSFMATHQMAPRARIVAYYVRPDNQEVVADALNFDIDGIFRTPVFCETNVEETKPGALVDVRVATNPNAYVAILGIDQSILLLKSGNDITQDDVIEELETYDSGNKNKNMPPWYRRRKRSIWWPGSTTSGEIFDDSSLILLSNGLVYRSLQFMVARDSIRLADTVLEENLQPPNFQLARRPDGRIILRKDFPETWLWTNATAGNDGNAVITSPIPDTITSWFISAFAMDRVSGLGIAPHVAKVTVFRPFFIKLSLPYSIIRGESVAIQAVVFNYQNKPVEAEVSIENKHGQFKFTEAGNEVDFDEAVKIEKKRKTILIPANDGSAVSFIITPVQLGYIDIKMTASTSNAGDAVMKKLLVKPEGQTQYFNKALLVDLRDARQAKSDFKQNISITIPNNAIPGSERVSVSSIGDILGPTVNNLDDLLRMPYGCGEQNMINFVPNIVVLDYLRRTNRLTPAIKAKATANIESGYQRELTYKRDDGSFSAFGNSDKAGSTWLTAFVLKSFTQAKQFIDIDQNVVDKATQWLLHRQRIDGSFDEPGEVHHKPMQGGSARKGTITAYAMIALLSDKNAKRNYSQEISRSEEYIWGQFQSTRNPYELTIIAYALHLADSKYKGSAYRRMMNFAKRTADHTWWTADLKEKEINHTDKQSAHFFYPNSNDVEMTAYALLTLLARSDLEDALPVLRWLISQQNSNGGYSSTQDTAIGLQALGGLAQRISTTTVSLSAKFNYETDGSARSKTIRIGSDNLMVLQRNELPSQTKWVELEATGFGAAVVQVSWQYNLAVSAEQPAFYLNPLLDHTSTENYLQLSICTHYKAGNSTNMAVMEVELPSGYVADVDALPSITRSKVVKRIDTANGDTNVVIYFDRITRDELCLTVPSHRSFRVANHKPVPVTVYDYYDRSQTARYFYEPKLAKVCDICDDDTCDIKCETEEGNIISNEEGHRLPDAAGSLRYTWQLLAINFFLINLVKYVLYN